MAAPQVDPVFRSENLTSKIIWPDFLDVQGWRDVHRNNHLQHPIVMYVDSDSTWIPTILAETGFFASATQVRKNRPELWRDRAEGLDVIKFKFATVCVLPRGGWVLDLA